MLRKKIENMIGGVFIRAEVGGGGGVMVIGVFGNFFEKKWTVPPVYSGPKCKGREIRQI